MDNQINKNNYKYDAFISYSHAADSKLAPSLQIALHKLAKPWHKKQALSVFRDQTDLSATPHLWKNIEQALHDSKYFVLMASPEAASSKWIKKEIEFWLKYKSKEQILIVLTDGDIIWDEKKGDFDWEKTNAVSPVLRGVFEEPLYVDLREFRSQRHLSVQNPEFKNRVVSLAATLHGKTVGDMIGEEVKQHKKTIRIRNTAIFVLATLTISSILGAYYAFKQKSIAEKRLFVALSRQLAAQSLSELDTWPIRSLLLALEANNITWKGKILRIPDAEQSLRQILSTVGGYPFGNFQSSVESVAFSPDGRWLAAAGGGKYGSHIAILIDTWERNPRPVYLRGHEKKITCIMFSPNGKWLATGSMDQTVRLWDVTVNYQSSFTHVLSSQDSWILSLAFSPCGRWLASGTGNIYGVMTTGSTLGHSVCIWDMNSVNSSEKPVMKYKHGDDVTDVKFSNNGQWLSTASRDGFIRLWELDHNGLHAEPIVLNENRSGVWVLSLAFSSDSHWLAAGRDGNAYLWNLSSITTHKNPFDLPHPGSVPKVEFSPDNKMLATACSDELIRLWKIDDLQTQNIPLVIRSHTNSITSIEFSSDGRWLLSGSHDTTARVWDLSSTNPSLHPIVLRGHESDIMDAAFSPDKYHLATASWDGSVRLWNFLANPTSEPIVLHGYLKSVSKPAFSPDSRLLAIGDADSVTILMDLTALEPSSRGFTIEQRGSGASFSIFSPDNRLLATVGGILDSRIRLWNLSDLKANPVILTSESPFAETGVFSSDSLRLIIVGAMLDRTVRQWDLRDAAKEPITFKLGDRDTTSALCSDGSWFACGTDEGHVKLWNMAELKPDAPIIIQKGHSTSITAVCFSHNHQWMVTGDNKGNVCIWKFHDNDYKKNPTVLHSHKNPIRSLAISPNCRLLATAGGYSDPTIRLWDLSNLKAKPLDLHGHDDSVISLAFSSDSKLLVSTSKDKTSRMWYLNTNGSTEESIIITRAEDPKSNQWGVRAAFFSPDGRWIATYSGPDGKAEIWQVNMKDLVSKARRTAGRKLSVDERLRYIKD